MMLEAIREVIDELVLALESITSDAQDPQGMKRLLADLGWVPDSVPQPLQDLAAIGPELVDIIGADPDEIPAEQVVKSIKRLVDVINGIVGYPDAAFPAGIDVPSFKATIGRELLDYVLVEHLLCHRYHIGGILKLGGLIRTIETGAMGLRRAHVKREVMWSRIGELLTDPIKGFREAFGWDSVIPQLTEVTSDLANLFESHGLWFTYFRPKGDLLSFINQGVVAPAEPLGLNLSLDDMVGAPESVKAGVKLIVIPPTANRGAGIAILPYVQLNDNTQEIRLSDTTSLSIRGNADFSKGIAIILIPGHEPEVHTGFLGGAGSDPRDLQIGLRIVPPSGEPERLLIGASDATRICLHTASISLGARRTSRGEMDVFVSLGLEKVRIVIKPAPNEADSFLAKILGKDGISAGVSMGMQLSSLTGFHLTGSGGLEMTLPLHKNIGQIELQAITLGLKTANGLEFAVGANIAGKLGPIGFAVEGAGFKLLAKFPDPPDGNLGPIDLNFDFKSPTGGGLMVNNGPLIGSGILSHDATLGRYAGHLDLRFGEIGLTAVGIITTKLPGGHKGFALFVNIGVTFNPPINLPFNFLLMGVGGLLAVNRTMDIEALRSGLRNRTLDSILFPKDPILNAEKIITDSERVFPVKEGRFIVGPMVKLGWGANGLITADLAIIIELPAPITVAVLGQIAAAFPTPNAALVLLNLDVLGVIDFAKKTLSIDATLYDSRIQTYELCGDAAVRMNWGDNPSFLMSVGGVHPGFTPPPQFPALRRLTVQLISRDDFHLSATTYMALSSNTFQFGAGLQLRAKACGVRIDGHLSFDTLFNFSPFEFEASITGHVAASYKGHDVASVALSFELSGPTPWHAKGKAKVSVLCWDVTAHFNKTWGNDQKALAETIDPLDPFLKELQLPGVWAFPLPPRRSAVESLKSTDVSNTAVKELLAHPAGGVELRQRVLPLSLQLEKFGNSDVSGHYEFDLHLELLKGNGQILPSEDVETSRTTEMFARGQFKKLSHADRLSKPSYEPFDGGVSVRPRKARVDGAVVACDLEYESIVIDANGETVQSTTPNRHWTAVKRGLALASVQRASVRYQGLGKFSAAGPRRVGVQHEAFAIVDKVTLRPISGLDAAPSLRMTQTIAEDLARRIATSSPTGRVAVTVLPESEQEDE